MDTTMTMGRLVFQIFGALAEYERSLISECTACEKCRHIGVRGGVYFEAGFALGLGKTVFLTCHEDRAKGVHFDIDHLNRIEWKRPEDLRENLKNSIEAVLGHGPIDPPYGQSTDSRQPERTAT